ncbi:hypothetical protein EDD16DRAFT_1119137 [Pisolithus croceorrhizus]|nr:hypothetical protein EDD16DRAFT_1119137 [Pisolithus croceorrhizus]
MMTDKTCPTGRDIVVHVLPILAAQYVMGVLVQLRNTALLRVALLPIVPWLAWRAFSLFDFSCGDHEKAQANALFASHMATICMRTAIWAMVQEPYVRDNVPKDQSTSVPMALWNVWDLLLTTRGIGWNWSQGIPIPQRSKEITSKTQFLIYAALRAVLYGLAFDAFTEAIRSFSPNFTSWKGETIFDPSLSVVSRYLRALQITYLAIWLAYCAIQWGYHSLSIVLVSIFRQHPSQWPPLFDKPWLSTSLSEIWGRRWHQMLRFNFASCGGIPFAYLFGRTGGILGTFLMSGIFHVVEFGAVGRGGSAMTVAGFFFMNGVGVLLERAWSKKVSPGRRVRGIWGWIWTFSWMAFWGVPLLDQWTRAGRFAADPLPGGIKPTMALLSLVLPQGADKGLILKCLCFGITAPFVVYSLFTLH